jgi:AraC-like DNA-binding protein
LSGLEASLLLGSAHSLVLAIALRRRARNRGANRYLAALLAALALLLLDGFLRARGVLTDRPHLIGLSAWVPWLIGPLVFLYVREMTAPDRARAHPAWRHFLVPAAYLALLVVTFYPRSAAFKLDVAEGGGSWPIRVTEVVLLVHGIGYAIASLVLLRRHRGRVEALFSDLRGVDLRWLIVLAALNALVWIGALAVFVVRATGSPEGSAASAIVPLGSTMTVFVIGYFQLLQAEIHVAPPTAPAPPPAAPEPAPLPTYQRARLAPADAAELEARIRDAMTTKKLYQRPGLTLPELADAVAATPHEVSQVLSTRMQRNFYNFVNEHRIEHVKAGLLATDRPVLDLAFEAGFQSKSTFNSAFRKVTGTTPRELRQRPSS